MNKNRIVNIHYNDTNKNWKDFLGELQLFQGQQSPARISDDVNLVLSEDNYSFSIRSNYGTPFETYFSAIDSWGVPSLITTGVEAVSTAATGQGESKAFNPWIRKVQAWKDTEPVKLSLTFSFRMGQYGLWDAAEEVAKPLLALLVPVLPVSIDSFFTQTGPALNGPQLLGNLLGQVINHVVGGNNDIQSLVSGIGDTVKSAVTRQTYNVTVNNQLVLMYSVCKSATCTISSEVDQHGLPISGNIALAFEGVVPPTRRLGTNPGSISGWGFHKNKLR